jgi:mycofactocin system glycosyltransferase
VLIAGSPLRLFRLSTGGAQVVAMTEVGEQPETEPVQQLLDRFVDAGALHPLYEIGPFTADDVTVVIPAHGRLPDRLPEGVELIVVDDGSPTPLTGPRLTTIRHDVNRGPAAARNTGLGAVTTPLVAFVDTDVRLPAGWLDPLLAHFADERVALVAPRVASAPGVSWLAGYEQRHSPLDLGTDPARVSPGTRVSYVPAATLLCRTAAIRELGGFDDALRLGEDVDLVWRLCAAGYRCRYEPTAVVEHEPRATVPEFLRQRFGYGRSAASLARRHPNALAPVRMSGWSALAWILLVARHPLLALGVAGGTTVALQRKLDDVPTAESARLAGLGHLAAGRQFANALTRVWWPLALVAAVVSRRARVAVAAAMVLPAIIDAVRERSVTPLRDAPFAAVDQMAYGAGVWAGVMIEREWGPLRPEFTNWPQRTGG